MAAGITELIFIVSDTKRVVKDYFGHAVELEHILEQGDDWENLRIVRNILPVGVSCTFLHQTSPLGLGHAVLCARRVVGDSPFAVLLCDDLIRCQADGALQQMVRFWGNSNGMPSAGRCRETGGAGGGGAIRHCRYRQAEQDNDRWSASRAQLG